MEGEMRPRMEMVKAQTDVLVIGGGLAGCMAAIRARDLGARVLMAEKSHALCSGQAGSGIDHIWGYIPPVHSRIGWTLEDLVEDHMVGVAHGFAKRELIRFIASEVYPRVLDLEKLGVKIRYDDSALPGKFRLVHQFHSIPSSLNVDGYSIKAKLTRGAEKRGVKIINRLMVTDLLTKDGRISGALGVGTRESKIYVIRAKSVILSAGGKTGRIGRESTGSACFNLHLPGSLSADGKAMALKAGLAIMNMEFLGARRYGLANYEAAGRPPRNTWQPAAAIVNYKGETAVPKSSFYDWGDLEKGYQIDAAETRRQWLAAGGITPRGMPSRKEMVEAGPFYVDCTGATEEEVRYVEWTLSHEGKCRQLLKHFRDLGVDLRKDKLELGLGSREIGNLAASGLLVDSHMETSIQGLFAAGDEVGGVPFGASSAAFTTGWRSGEMAAKHAGRQKSFPPSDEEQVEALKKSCSDMMKAREGCTWREVEETMHNIMDTYCGDVKTAPMLTRGLDRLVTVKAVPIRAANHHELSRGLEVKSLLSNAEMIMRASLAREESRKYPVGFYRADFPNQNDAEWRAFSTVRLQKGAFVIDRIPIEA
jgi:succinate dehydrogenase/fumarate reductase flavoprotein subunit